MTELYFCRIESSAPSAGSEAAHRLLEEAASRRWPELPKPLPLEEDEKGKPYIRGYPGCQFSLSHSGGWAACALSDGPVGVDIQQHREIPALVSRKFSGEEQEWLRNHPDSFFDLWVKKEAYLKALGAGLTIRLDRFTVLPLENNMVAGCRIWLADPPEKGYSCAICETG